jgi:hypothetical protein
VELLDTISPDHYDAEATVSKASRYEHLTTEEQNEYLGLWEFAGLDEAAHPLSCLLRESHNATSVIRDLDGSLQMLWEEPRSGEWNVGPLSRQNLIDDDQIADALEADPEWLADCGLPLTTDELTRLLDSLRMLPAPVMRF